MPISTILGWIATILFTIELIPQYFKTIKTQTVKGVSVIQYLLFLVGNIIALIYAIMISQPPLVIKYILALIAVIIYLTIYYLTWRKENDCNK
jgi:MtN3 and saliva related transmembrane protein